MEIGTNSLGEIAELSNIVQPDHVIITDVSIGHLEGLKSLDNIVEEKASICSGQRQKGLAIIPSGIEKFSQLKAKVRNFGSDVISFGDNESSDVRISTTEVLGNAITSTIVDQKQKSWNVNLKTAGKHYMKNAAALLALVFSLKLNPSKAIFALESWSPLAGRGQVLEIEVKHSNNKISIHLIDESYNANPGSVKSSLDTLASIYSYRKSKYKYNRRIAVLGDMLELGFFEVEEHVNISRFARLDKIDKIYCVGSRMRKLYDVLPSLKQGFWTETAEEMQHILVNKLKDGDIVMIKGSFSIGMNTIVNKLKNT